MSTRTKTQITIQTRQVIIVHPLQESFRTWCEQCLEVVVALTQESVTDLLQIPTSTLHELMASRKLHPVEVGASSPLICCNSLSGSSTQNEILIEGERQ